MKNRELSDSEKIFEFSQKLSNALHDITKAEMTIELLGKIEHESKKYYFTISAVGNNTEQVGAIFDNNLVVALKEEMKNQLDRANERLEELKKHIVL